MIISLLAATAIAQVPLQPYNCGYTIAPNIQVREEMIDSECKPRQKSLAKGQKPAPDHNYECGIIRSVSFTNRDEYTIMRGQRVGTLCQPIKFSFPGGEIRLRSDNWEDCETESDGVITPGKGWEQCLRNANAREYTHPVHSQVVELWGF